MFVCLTGSLTILSLGFLAITRFHRRWTERNAAMARENLEAAEKIAAQAKAVQGSAEVNRYIASTLYGVEGRLN